MEQPTKLLLVGLAVGTSLVVFSSITAGRLQSRISELEVICEAESDVSDLARFFGAGPNCEPIELAAEDPGEEPTAVQSELALSQRLLARWGGPWPIGLAVLVVVTSGVPWGWQFLLRRLRELREAVLGRRHSVLSRPTPNRWAGRRSVSAQCRLA